MHSRSAEISFLHSSTFYFIAFITSIQLDVDEGDFCEFVAKTFSRWCMKESTCFPFVSVVLRNAIIYISNDAFIFIYLFN